MKIGKIDATRLRNHKHFQFHTEFLKLAKERDPKIKPLLEKYIQLYERLDEALNKISKSALTFYIDKADKERDKIWRGLVDTNSAAINHFDPAAREAAKRLKIVFDAYGNIARKRINEQSSATYNVLRELRGNRAKDVETLGLGQWVSELEERNTAFGDLMRERYDETAAKCSIVVKEARAEIDKCYREIIDRINAMIVVDGDENCKQFAKKMNAVIADYAAEFKMKAMSKRD